MSQHLYLSAYKGQPVSILMGWDRPMQGFFMVIELEKADGIVYSNLDDPDLDGGGGLSVPALTIQQIEIDAASNVGNRRVVYSKEGRVQGSGKW